MNHNGTALHEGDRFPSPFAKLIALGYHDGPTEGLLLSELAGEAYLFAMLDSDDMLNLRVFELSPLPSDVFAEVTAILSEWETPRWPVWVPSWRPEMNAKVDPLLKKVDRATWILTAVDLLTQIVACRRLYGPTHPVEIRDDNGDVVEVLTVSKDQIWGHVRRKLRTPEEEAAILADVERRAAEPGEGVPLYKVYEKLVTLTDDEGIKADLKRRIDILKEQDQYRIW